MLCCRHPGQDYYQPAARLFRSVRLGRGAAPKVAVSSAEASHASLPIGGAAGDGAPLPQARAVHPDIAPAAEAEAVTVTVSYADPLASGPSSEKVMPCNPTLISPHTSSPST